MCSSLRWGSVALLALGGLACSRSLLLPIEDDGIGGAQPSSTNTGTSGGGLSVPADTCDPQAWTRSFGGDGDDELLALGLGPACRVTLFGRHDEAFTADGRPVEHESGNDAFVIQLNGAGQVRWAQALTTTGTVEEVAGAATADGGVILLTNLDGEGRIGDLELDSAGGSDVVAVALDALGNPRWSLQLGDQLSQFGTAITTDDEGNAYLAGRFRGVIDGPDFALVSAGNNTTGFVIKVSPNGEPLWGFQLPPDASVFPNALFWHDGRLFFGGAVSSNPLATPIFDMPTEDIDAFVCLISPDDGSYIRGLSFPSPGFDVINRVTVSESGVFLGGAFEDVFFGPSPLFGIDGLEGLTVVASLDLVPFEAFAFQGPGDQSVNDFGPPGGYVGGRFAQSLSFDGGPPLLTTNATADGFFISPGEDLPRALGASTEAEVMAIRPSPELGVVIAGTFAGQITPPSPNEPAATNGGRDAFVMRRP